MIRVCLELVMVCVCMCVNELCVLGLWAQPVHVTEDNLHVRDSGKLLVLDQLLARIRIEVCIRLCVCVCVCVCVCACFVYCFFVCFVCFL